VRGVATVVFWVVLTLTALALLWAFSGAVVLFLLSIAVAGAIRPIIDALLARRLSLRAATAVAYAGCLVTVGILVYVLAARLLVEVPFALDRLVEEYGDEFEHAISEFQATTVAEHAVGSTMAAFDLIGRVLLVIVMSIYWTSGRDSFERLCLSLMPVERRKQARTIWIETRSAVGAYLQRELGQSVLATLALSVGFFAAGCDLWALATVAVLLLRLIPLLGGGLAVGAALIAGLASGTLPAILAAVITIAVLLALRTLVAPRWFGIERPIDPILGVLLILALAGTFGLAGLIAAPLVAVAIQTAFSEIVAMQATEAELPSMDDLVRRANRLERRFRWTPPPPSVTSLLARLQQLIERAATR
jgi:predicted PurR-regulated permease PerM